MLKSEEIKSELILCNVTQAEISRKIGLSRTQISTIIGHGQVLTRELTKILGYNPFHLSKSEIKKIVNND